MRMSTLRSLLLLIDLLMTKNGHFKNPSYFQNYTVKKLMIFPSPGGIFPARESLVSNIPPGDGKIDILFTVYISRLKLGRNETNFRNLCKANQSFRRYVG